MGWRQAVVVRRVVLQDIAIDGRLQAVHWLRVERALSVLEPVEASLGVVDLGQRMRLRHPTTTSAAAASSSKADVLGSPHAHATHDGLLRVMETTPKATIQLLPLELVLNPLAVRRIADQREYGTDPFHKHGTLSRVSIVQSGLYKIHQLQSV